MSFYNNKKYKISSTYENKKQSYQTHKSYYHKTDLGVWDYIEGDLVFTPYNKERV
jgi:hypothetical protein